jgi:hypothetical protein
LAELGRFRRRLLGVLLRLDLQEGVDQGFLEDAGFDLVALKQRRERVGI